MAGGLIVRHATGVDSHWHKCVHIRIVANLSESIGSTGPKLTSVRLSRVIHEEECVVLAAGDLVDRHLHEAALDLSWLNNSVSVGISQAQLALIRITTAENFVLGRHKD